MHVSAAAYFDFSYDIVNFILKLWCIIFVLPVILPGVMLQTVKVVFMVYFMVCCRLFSSVLHCSVVFVACFVACCRMFSGVLQTVQWCTWPALWCVADCSVVYMVHFVVCCRDCSVFCRLFSGVHGLLCGVLQTVQCFADCSVMYMVCCVVCCRLFSGVNGMLCGVLLTVQWCEWRVFD